MNLSKKSFLTIVPVITVFFVVATSVAYQSQKDQIIRLEKNRLKLALAELETRYNQYNSFAESYLYAIIESNALKLYLNETEDKFRRVALVQNLESNLRKFTRHRSDYLSLTIAQANPDPYIKEYIELSQTPFSSIPGELAALSLAGLNPLEQQTPSFRQGKNRSFLAFSALLDPVTMAKPKAERINKAINLSFAIEPTLFFSEKSLYESEFDIKIHIIDKPEHFNSEDPVFFELEKGLYLATELTAENISHQLHPTRLKLTSLSALFLISCALVLFVLLNRIVTSPVRRLEKRIKNLSLGDEEILNTGITEKDEIGRLAKEFTTLYSKLTAAYNHSNEMLHTDQLTGLANLYELNRDFEQRIEHAKTNGETLAFLYLDLDNFKFINDRYGHELGDKVLIAFGNQLRTLIKKHILNNNGLTHDWGLSRISGDEFGIILSNSPSDEMVTVLSNNILSMFEGGFNFSRGRYPISVSIGAVNYPQDGDTVSQLISNADTAMYQSKRLGKNRLSYYSEKIAYKLRRSREIEHELKQADFDKEFYLTYLPIVDTESLEVRGVEALIRWNSPRLGSVSPAEFIPVAETCGFYQAIDSWVINQSFSSYQSIKQLLGRDITLSLNLSTAQIALNKVHEEILSLSDIYAIPRQHIQFELTETVGAEFTKGLENLLSNITNAGFKLAIDDFGTGYTSLQQLADYPASTIKIDKSFLDSTMRGQRRVMLEPLMKLCHAINMTVTVEGIETREQYEYMRKINVDNLQGFLFCQPVTIEELPGAMTTLDRLRPTLL